MLLRIGLFAFTAASAACLLAEEPVPAPRPAIPDSYKIPPGTHIPLSLINSVSTKNAAPGDRVYLQTAYPILDHGKIVIPPGSYVEATVTQTKRPGRVKGRGEMYIRFDSLTLPNGVTRDFRASLSALDGMAGEELNKSEGKIKSGGNKGGDTQTVAEAAGAGASVGALTGMATGHYGMGAGIGAAAGAAAGLAAVLLTRGPDAVLERGSTVEMVLDRPLEFQPREIDFSGAPPSASLANGPGPQRRPSRGIGLPGLPY